MKKTSNLSTPLIKVDHKSISGQIVDELHLISRLFPFPRSDLLDGSRTMLSYCHTPYTSSSFFFTTFQHINDLFTLSQCCCYWTQDTNGDDSQWCRFIFFLLIFFAALPSSLSLFIFIYLFFVLFVLHWMSCLVDVILPITTINLEQEFSLNFYLQARPAPRTNIGSSILTTNDSSSKKNSTTRAT